jgi:hypothetical protein
MTRWHFFMPIFKKKIIQRKIVSFIYMAQFLNSILFK